MAGQAEPLRLKIPTQDLDMLSFCVANPKKLKEWVDGLPQMNIGECAKQLYAAIQEINRYKTDTDARFQMLEIMRPAIRYICASLGKHFLNKAVVLPPKEAKIANLAQALQNHLATGYKCVVAQLFPRIKVNDREALRLAVKAIHRGMSEQSLVLLRSFQLYFPAPAGFWREAHLLYVLSERFGVLDVEIPDPEDGDHQSSVYDLYRRALLLATAKPNQLRQQQIDQVYAATKNWCRYADMGKGQSKQGLFAVDLISDTPPIYNALMKQVSNNENLRYFDASTLSDHLRVQLQLPSDQRHPILDFEMPKDVANDLTRLLIQAWGVLTERAFTRIDERGQLCICIGLSATHYFVSGKSDFNAMVKTGAAGMLDMDSNNPFLSSGPTHRRDVIERHDVWGLGTGSVENADGSIEMNIASFSDQQRADVPDKYPSYHCDVVNTSPGGFCLSWKQDVPPQVKTGEIVGIQEDAKQHWSIGVIRWVKQFKNEGARMGIEMLAPKAEPCGTQVIHKKGGVTEFMRTLLLPELKAIGQPSTLLTPNIAFHVGYKVNINQTGHVSKAQLVKQVSSTASFSQFQYKSMTPMPEPKPDLTPEKPEESKASSSDDDFDSIWSSL